MEQWDERDKTKHGDLGEKLVFQHFTKNAYEIVLRNVEYDDTENKFCSVTGAHHFDAIISKGEKFAALDVKAKARRNKYPDTGSDVKYVNTYWKVFHALKDNPKFADFYLFFVDEKMKEIYYFSFKECLKKQFAHTEGNIVYFDLKYRHVIAEIAEEDAEQLKKFSAKTRNYSY